jgi:hypothetical protein
MIKESTAEIFQKIQKNTKLFDKALSAGEKVKAKYNAEQCVSLFYLLAKKVPLREIEYHDKAKEWEIKIVEIDTLPLTNTENKATSDTELDKRSIKHPKKSPPDAFISYSQLDRDVAHSLCSFLESNGITCWISPRDVLPGANYPASIIEGIDKSRIIILVFSKSSNTSRHVFRELDEAILKNIRILPFRIHDEPLSDDMKYFINIHHWLDAYKDSPETYFDELLGSIRSYLDTTNNNPTE